MKYMGAAWLNDFYKIVSLVASFIYEENFQYENVIKSNVFLNKIMKECNIKLYDLIYIIKIYKLQKYLF